MFIYLSVLFFKMSSNNAAWITSLALAAVVVAALWFGKRAKSSSQIAADLVMSDPYQQSRQSTLNPVRVDWNIPGGFAGIDVMDLTAYQRWAISRGYYDLDRMQTDGFLDINIPYIPFI